MTSQLTDSASHFTQFADLLRRRPQAAAALRSAPDHPGALGQVRFYQTARGVLVAAEVWNLPITPDNCGEQVYGFHIHAGGSCTGTESDPFADALTHYDPTGLPHPCHAGDLPPLFGNDGYAFSVVLTDRFTVEEIMGKTIIIHSQPDDFTTQPAGNAGHKIACGVIMALR